MKPFLLCVAFCLLVGLTGCHRGQDKAGGTSSTEATASIPGGQQISTAGVILSFPAGWKPVDLNSDRFEQSADQEFGDDPQFAAMRRQARNLVKQGTVKLIAFEASTAASGFATNCNITMPDIQGQQVTLEQVANGAVSQIAPLVTKGTQPKIRYVNLKSGRAALIRSELPGPGASAPKLVSLVYFNLKDSKLAMVTFTAPMKDEAHIQSVADQVMGTFHFGE